MSNEHDEHDDERQLWRPDEAHPTEFVEAPHEQTESTSDEPAPWCDEEPLSIEMVAAP